MAIMMVIVIASSSITNVTTKIVFPQIPEIFVLKLKECNAFHVLHKT